MPVTIDQNLRDRIFDPHADEPYLWLWEIEADVSVVATPVFRLVGFPEEVIHDGKTFYPIAMDQGDIDEKQDGSLPRLELSIDNTTLLPATYVDKGSGFIGNIASATVIPRDLVTGTPTGLEGRTFTFEVAGAEVTNEAVTLTLELPNFLNWESPQMRYSASRCPLRFGGSLCGYVLSATAGHVDCPKDLPACRIRGNDMVLRNFPRIHPQRFGAFPGLPLR